MNRAVLSRTWLIATGLAALGLIVGIAAAMFVTSSDRARYQAESTLAMLPSQQVPITQASGFWEVLNKGQATRSAAIVIADHKWLEAAAVAAGVPKSDLTLAAGAVPDTTLITVTMQANSAGAAESALDKVISDAATSAAKATGPFRLEVVGPAAGSAKALSPAKTQLFGALGLAGLLLGAGGGLWLSQRSSRKVAGQRRHSRAALSATNGHVRAEDFSSVSR